jgi:hypothetical protein
LPAVIAPQARNPGGFTERRALPAAPGDDTVIPLPD